MKKQKFLCVDLDVYTQSHDLVQSVGTSGMLTMTQEGEHFIFEEGKYPRHHRNTNIWSGHRINVKRNIFGQLCVYFRRLQLTKELDARKLAQEIRHELETAQEELAL